MDEMGRDVVFEDFFPSMVEKLGAEGLLKELCNGFQLLRDVEKGVITLESLKKNMAQLGLGGIISEEELKCMMKEGEMDGDGCLSEMEFCVLMFYEYFFIVTLYCHAGSIFV